MLAQTETESEYYLSELAWQATPQPQPPGGVFAGGEEAEMKAAGGGPGGFVILASPFSVPVVLRLVWPFDGDADVIGLLLGHAGELHAQLRQV